MLGDNPLLWCWPTVPPGDGLKYPIANPQGEWIELQNPREPEADTKPWQRGTGFAEP